MIIRPFKNKDQDNLVRVWYETSIIAHSFISEIFWNAHKEDLKHKYLPLAETWVAEVDGELVGFISLLDNYIGGLYVAPSHQGKGVGTQLIQYVKKIRDNLHIGVFKENEKAHAFYEKCGFVYLFEEVQKETGHIVITMQLKKRSLTGATLRRKAGK